MSPLHVIAGLGWLGEATRLEAAGEHAHAGACRKRAQACFHAFFCQKGRRGRQ